MTFFGFSGSAMTAARKGLEDEIRECTERPDKVCTAPQSLQKGRGRRGLRAASPPKGRAQSYATFFSSLSGGFSDGYAQFSGRKC